MKNLRSLIILTILISAIPVVSEANGHSLFNSAESFLGGYRVQVATLPEFPQIGENSQILFRITDYDFEEVDNFTLGVRIFYNDQQIDAFPPESFQGAHTEFNYVWENSGNHIVKVDLYDMDGSSEILTYTFNMGTQSPFGYIFFIAITVGASALTIVLVYIYFPKKLKFKSRS